MALCVACSSSSSSGSGGTTQVLASQAVGASGGTVTTPDGVSIAIPAGALSSNVTITVTKLAAAPSVPSGSTLVSEAYQFGPEGQTFAQPVAVTLPYDATLLPSGASSTTGGLVVFRSPVTGTTQTWSAIIGGSVSGGKATVSTTGFSYWEVGWVDGAECGGSIGSSTGGGSTGSSGGGVEAADASVSHGSGGSAPEEDASAPAPAGGSGRANTSSDPTWLTPEDEPGSSIGYGCPCEFATSGGEDASVSSSGGSTGSSSGGSSGSGSSAPDAGAAALDASVPPSFDAGTGRPAFGDISSLLKPKNGSGGFICSATTSSGSSGGSSSGGSSGGGSIGSQDASVTVPDSGTTGTGGSSGSGSGSSGSGSGTSAPDAGAAPSFDASTTPPGDDASAPPP